METEFRGAVKTMKNIVYLFKFYPITFMNLDGILFQYLTSFTAFMSSKPIIDRLKPTK